MNLIDTHSHIYLKAFNNDRDAVVERAQKNSVNKIFMPNIDSGSIPAMMEAAEKYPETCFPMMGIHPSSVQEAFEKELETAEKHLETGKFYAVGETGIDLYRDTTYIKEQEIAFRQHVEWALRYNLPLVIHIRKSFDEVFRVLEEFSTLPPGIFHCFGGGFQQAEKAVKMGFTLGIGGVVTFKNAKLAEVVKQVSLEHLVLETDAPFLAPDRKSTRLNSSHYS